MGKSGFTILEAALAKTRSRSSWNDWLSHAERPASAHEEDKIQRAATMASEIVKSNPVLTAEGAAIFPQGSYFNNTNVRTEADMDLRVQLPGIRTVYLDGAEETQADAALGLIKTGKNFPDILATVREELVRDCNRIFGTGNVDASGSKAITVKGLSGSRADCDLVPAFRLHVVSKNTYGYDYSEGVAIFGKGGALTMNFPEQHHANGITKRKATSHRFKRNVRMLKRLNYELETVGDIPKCLPSFFVECLVYCVEDEYFLQDADDAYLRLVRILTRISALLENDAWCEQATEVNDIKFLFRDGQSWTRQEARAFVAAALKRLEL